jgi:hypothetical protein
VVWVSEGGPGLAGGRGPERRQEGRRPVWEAEQDILVMGRMAKPYLDEIRAKAKPKLKQAIDRIWRRIVDEGR